MPLGCTTSFFCYLATVECRVAQQCVAVVETGNYGWTAILISVANDLPQTVGNRGIKGSTVNIDYQSTTLRYLDSLRLVKKDGHSDRTGVPITNASFICDATATK